MSIEKVTIEKVSATDKKKDGTELMGKFGKFWRVGIITKEHGEDWLNGFTSKEPTWIEGDVVDLDVTTEVWEKPDGTKVDQLKFRVPKKEDLKDAKIAELEAKLAGKKDEPIIDLDEEDEAIVDNF